MYDFQVRSGADVVAVVVVLSSDAIVQQTRDILELAPRSGGAKTFMTVVQSTTLSQSPLVGNVAFALFGPR